MNDTVTSYQKPHEFNTEKTNLQPTPPIIFFFIIKFSTWFQFLYVISYTHEFEIVYSRLQKRKYHLNTRKWSPRLSSSLYFSVWFFNWSDNNFLHSNV